MRKSVYEPNDLVKSDEVLYLDEDNNLIVNFKNSKITILNIYLTQRLIKFAIIIIARDVQHYQQKAIGGQKCHGVVYHI